MVFGNSLESSAFKPFQLYIKESGPAWGLPLIFSSI